MGRREEEPWSVALLLLAIRPLTAAVTVCWSIGRSGAAMRRKKERVEGVWLSHHAAAAGGGH